MKRKTRRSRHQLALALEQSVPPPWPPSIRAALIGVLADLLLEALAPEVPRAASQEDRDEHEDQI